VIGPNLVFVSLKCDIECVRSAFPSEDVVLKGFGARLMAYRGLWEGQELGDVDVAMFATRTRSPLWDDVDVAMLANADSTF